MNEILDEDDLASIEELKELFKEETSDLFAGEFQELPNPFSYQINSLCKVKKILYINSKTGWKKLLEEKEQRATYSGGGVGIAELNRVLDERLANYTPGPGTSGGDFTGYISATNVIVSGDLINTSANNVEEVLQKFDSIISSKIVLGKYETNDVYEEANGDLYVGMTTTSGDWYFKRVVDSAGDLIIRHANVSNNITITTYTQAKNNYLTLTYSSFESLII